MLLRHFYIASGIYPPTNEKEPQRLLLSASEELEKKQQQKGTKKRDVPAKKTQEIKKRGNKPKSISSSYE